jgi:phospholipid/cholesterol/gamma-HCH transport system substrate-binding protein
VYGDRRGPHSENLCRRAINDEWGQDNLPPDALVPDIVDGVEQDTGKEPGRTVPFVDVSSGYAGTAAEREVVEAVAAPALGMSADEFPDVGTLLFGPLARGAEVVAR